ncbi:MAG: DNA/RNA non-specific endonuclease [Breznakibacter sp.]
MKKIILCFYVLLIHMGLVAQDYYPKSGGEFIKHSYFSLSYSEDNEQAEWVYYELYPALITGSMERSDNFRPDPKVSTGSSQLNDYKGSGYDRGHLCPAGSMKINSTAMSESFYLSNMSPQEASFNRGIWKRLEDTVREWAINEDKIYVVTGPVFKNNKGSIGANKVTVPGWYYKIVYVASKDKMVGFLLPNEKGTMDLPHYCITVDSLESLTGIDFFHQLEDSIETKLESSTDIKSWDFSKSSNSTSEVSGGTAIRCKGIAKSTGTQCKNKTNNENGYCHVHQTQAPLTNKSKQTKPSTSIQSYNGQCCATTKAGSRCKRNASNGSRYCWQHQ